LGGGHAAARLRWTCPSANCAPTTCRSTADNSCPSTHCRPRSEPSPTDPLAGAGPALCLPEPVPFTAARSDQPGLARHRNRCRPRCAPFGRLRAGPSTGSGRALHRLAGSRPQLCVSPTTLCLPRPDPALNLATTRPTACASPAPRSAAERRQVQAHVEQPV